jgi:hypothetical protein
LIAIRGLCRSNNSATSLPTPTPPLVPFVICRVYADDLGVGGGFVLVGCLKPALATKGVS